MSDHTRLAIGLSPGLSLPFTYHLRQFLASFFLYLFKQDFPSFFPGQPSYTLQFKPLLFFQGHCALEHLLRLLLQLTQLLFLALKMHGLLV